MRAAKFIDRDVLTVALPAPKGKFLRALSALTHQAKNLYNTGMYLVRQVLAAYEYDPAEKVGRIKAELHPEQRCAIEHFNKQVESINAARKAEHPAKLARDSDAKLKLVPLLTDVCANPTKTVLDATVLDNAVRTWPNANGAMVYARLPGAMAQQVLKRLREAFSAYFLSLEQFNADPAAMTGRPRLPNYRPKHERYVLEMPCAQVHGGFPVIKRKIVPEDYLEQSSLPPSVHSE